MQSYLQEKCAQKRNIVIVSNDSQHYWVSAGPLHSERPRPFCAHTKGADALTSFPDKPFERRGAGRRIPNGRRPPRLLRGKRTTMKPDIETCLEDLNAAPHERARLIRHIHRITPFCQTSIDRWIEENAARSADLSASQLDSVEPPEPVVSDEFNDSARETSRGDGKERA